MRPRQNWFRGRSALGDETTFDQEVLTDGIRLSLIGMGVVFAVLSILALAIKAFDRIDSIIPEQGSAEPKTASATAVAPTTETTQQPDSASDDVLTAAASGWLWLSQRSKDPLRRYPAGPQDLQLTLGLPRDAAVRCQTVPPASQ